MAGLAGVEKTVLNHLRTVAWALSGGFNQKAFTAIISFSAGRKQCQLEGVKIKIELQTEQAPSHFTDEEIESPIGQAPVDF